MNESEQIQGVIRAEDYTWMREAISLARESLTRTAPNPRVGCVLIDRDGELISSGVTNPPGGLHAEAQALKRAEELGKSTRGATAYVTLEPCSHIGRTGPCADALIRAQVSRVCIGILDPNPLVGGRGVERLRAAGVEVVVGVQGEECARLHAPFLKWMTTGRPWVSLKGAMTLDGCLATARGHSKWITGDEARDHVHRLRAQVDALMVGGETARRDRPALTVRRAPGTDPTPVIISRRLSIPNDLTCLAAPALLIHGPDAPKERRERLRDRGAQLHETPYLERQPEQLNLDAALEALGAEGVTHLCVEGGGHLHGAFLDARLADDVHLYIAPRLIGRGKPLFNFSSVDEIGDGWRLTQTRSETLGADLYLYGRLTLPEA